MDPHFDTEPTVSELDPDDLLTLIYTSGTTGPPKGVQLTHRNLLTLVSSVDGIVPFPEDGGRVISWLPAAHIAERGAHYYLPINLGLTVTICPDPRKIIEFLPAGAPELVLRRASLAVGGRRDVARHVQVRAGRRPAVADVLASPGPPSPATVWIRPVFGLDHPDAVVQRVGDVDVAVGRRGHGARRVERRLGRRLVVAVVAVFARSGDRRDDAGSADRRGGCDRCASRRR